MSALHDKINSYALERGIEFDQTFTTTPTRTGTNPLISAFTQNTTSNIVYEPTVGPIGGAGSWRFNWNSTAATNSYFRAPSSGSNEMLGNADGDYSVGLWVRFSGIPSNNTNTVFFTFGSTTGNGFNIAIGGSTSANAGKLVFNSSAGNVASTTAMPLNTWHYLAILKTPSNISIYINNELLITTGATGTTAATTWMLGNTAATTLTTDVKWNVSNYYMAPTSVIGATQIGEIWTAGSTAPGVNITFDADPATATALAMSPAITGNANEIVSPATASALQTEPTIAVETGDHVEITTSIPVSAEFPPATVSGQSSVNINVGPATAYSELVNNIIVGSSNTVAFSAEEFVASAELVKPFLSESPMFASAEMGNNTVYVDPNYFNAVIQSNPYIYINNGAAAGSIINYGSQTGTFTRGTDFSTLQDGGSPLNLVREGDSWRGVNKNNSQAYLEFTTSNASQNPAQLIADGNFALEFWAKPLAFPSTAASDGFGSAASFTNKSFLESDALSLRLSPVNAGGDTRSLELVIKSTSSATTTLRVGLTSSGVLLNNWNHIVVNVYQSGINASQRLVQVWVNGSVRINETISFTAWTNSDTTTKIIGSDSASLNFMADGFFDEIAWYSEELTNSEIIEHFQLINTLSPDFTDFAEEFVASADIGDHQFTVTSNAIPEIKEATATALLVLPTLIAGRSFTHNASPMTASATTLTPGVSLGITFLATPNIAYAESVNAYHLNSIYSDYVQANITPYRYVTFDGANAFVDYGTDADYSVIPTSVGGTIVNPDEGINGKSAKTAGSSYTTDGVILKESEWNDTWGTGQFSYHSSFWMEEAPEDNSTGLRVLWNLNGYKDNQHVILYSYQNKLRMQFNNGSGTHLDFATTNNIDLFDGLRHFIVVAFDHTNNNNNQVLLYVDSVLVLTCSLGSYNGQTVNGTTFVGPNDEANNHPRLGVGCLITPLGVTALPVVPTNTRLYIDEIVWAKTAINQTGVTALYNVMPDKDNSEYVSDLFEASAQIVAPALSTSALFVASPASASALIVGPTITANRSIVISVDEMTASAQFVPALRLDNIIFDSDVMVATATFNDAGVRITVSGGPMLATVKIANNYVNGIKITTNTTNVPISEYDVASPWAAWLRATEVYGIYPTREVK